MQRLYDELEKAAENMARGYDGMREESYDRLSEADKHKLVAFLKEVTGSPFVDACMRALHQSGCISQGVSSIRMRLCCLV